MATSCVGNSGQQTGSKSDGRKRVKNTIKSIEFLLLLHALICAISYCSLKQLEQYTVVINKKCRTTITSKHQIKYLTICSEKDIENANTLHYKLDILLIEKLSIKTLAQTRELFCKMAPELSLLSPPSLHTLPVFSPVPTVVLLLNCIKLE